ncbi:uncharacterized mitochondrial protein AtMg00860-like [Aristolochia californica]|uniref:uncharacterized mitochondrial protein AtMg00860-like n=1 Tax=Aristolochia californica TaxID=171875 RepID=UPI0035DB3A19
MDPEKIEAIMNWPPPTHISALGGFLGLARCYRKFIHNYAPLAAPLSNLLRRNAFHWNDITANSFQNLKKALATAPVLHLPDFEEAYVVECDASGGGIGAVLQQNQRPIAYFSYQLALHHHKLQAYERELIGLVKAIRHWRL